RLISALQKQALLRIQQLRIRRRDVEQQRVELVHPSQEATPNPDPPGKAHPIRRHPAHTITTTAQHPPKLVHVRRLRVPARQPHDRHITDPPPRRTPPPPTLPPTPPPPPGAPPPPPHRPPRTGHGHHHRRRRRLTQHRTQ